MCAILRDNWAASLLHSEIQTGLACPSMNRERDWVRMGCFAVDGSMDQDFHTMKVGKCCIHEQADGWLAGMAMAET